MSHQHSRGASTPEYAFMLALILLGTMAAVQGLLGGIDDLFRSFAATMGSWF